MKKQVYFISFFICFYFLMSFHPIITKFNGETIPFFSFRLYSNIPENYTKYDLIISDTNNPKFILFQNNDLNRLELKYINNKLLVIQNEYEKEKKINTCLIKKIIKNDKIKEVYFVKIQGNYLKTYKDNEFSVEIIEKIKI